MVYFQFTDRLSKKERAAIKPDLSSLHLLANAAVLVYQGKLGLPSSVSDVDDEKKETVVTSNFGPTCVRWVGRKKRSPRARNLATFDHSVTTASGPICPAVVQNKKQETWCGLAENCKKRPRAFHSTESHEADRVAKKPTRTQNKNLAVLTGPSELPRIFMDKVLGMCGGEVKLVVEKHLSATDLNASQSRFSVPKSRILSEFLSDQEIGILDSKKGIKVSLIDPRLTLHHGLQLKKWIYSSKTFSYVLINRWNAVAHPSKQNGLKEDDLVRLWSFRVDGRLCFCLTTHDD